MSISQSRSVFLTMAVSFAVSFALMYRPRESQDQPPPTIDATPRPAGAHQPASAPRSMPAEISIAERPKPAAIAVLDGAEPLPIAFHIRDRRDLKRIEGDIRNISSQPMSVTLRAVSAITHTSSEMSFNLAPGEAKAYNSDDGLAMQANDELMVQSPPYQDRTVRVP